MRNFASFMQFLFVAIALYVGYKEIKNKAAKNSRGNKPQTIFDILSSRANAIKTHVDATHGANIELHAYDHYLYVRNSGNKVARDVVLHSKQIAPMDVGTDKKGQDIQPGEEIIYFVTSFEYKKISNVMTSWHDDMGYHKTLLFVKQKSDFS